MADKKISALPASTTPLAGTEVLPIVQSSTTKQVSVANLTAGRAVSAATLALDKGGSGTVATLKGGTRTLYIYGDNDAFYISTDASLATAIGINETSDFVNIYANNAEQLKVDSTGLVTVKTGNVYFNTAGKGIDFSANTHAAGMTSELLNWYEEGTWTPAYATTGNPYTSVTYGIQSGTYTRIGRMVSIKLRIRTSAVTIGTASGALIITGLPFTSAASGCPVTIGYADSFSTNAPINAEVNGSATTIALYYRATVGGSVVSMQYNYLGTGATDNDLTIAGFYYV